MSRGSADGRMAPTRRDRKEYGPMANTMMMDRTGMGMPGMGMPGMASSPMGGTAAPMMPNMLMVPRCTMKMEKCTGGMMITCSCEDPMACSMMQNLCMMLQGGM